MNDHPDMTPEMFHSNYFWPFGSSDVKRLDDAHMFGVKHSFTDTYDPEVSEVSVVRHSFSYGHQSADLWEIGVFLTDGSMRPCFEHDDTVEGFLTAAKVVEYLGKLKVRPTCIVDPDWRSNVPDDDDVPPLTRQDIDDWFDSQWERIGDMHEDEFEMWQQCQAELGGVQAWQVVASPNLLADAVQWAHDLRAMADERRVLTEQVGALRDACVANGLAYTNDGYRSPFTGMIQR